LERGPALLWASVFAGLWWVSRTRRLRGAVAATMATFLQDTGERPELNQYWFSADTISAFVDEVAEAAGSAALVSSPSIFFSLPHETRARSRVLDFDRQWERDPGYVYYDYNDPLSLPQDLRARFNFVLVDPPFITREVWCKYA